MRIGLAHFVVGLVFLAAGVLTTLYSQEIYWWGAIVFGGVEIVRGALLMWRHRHYGMR